MKKVLLYIMLLLCVNYTFAVNQQALKDFDSANKLYADQQFAAAAEKYEQLLTDDYISEAVYYNLGNCYYKLRNVGLSIYNYEKALQLNPNNEKVRTNLKFAEKMRLDTFEPKTKLSTQHIIHNAIGFFTYNQWAVSAVVGSFMILLSFVAFYFISNSTLKRIFFLGILLFVVVTVLSLIAAFTEKKYHENERYGIIIQETVAVKKEPRITSKNEKIVHEGTKVFVLETTAKWHKVTLPDLTEGYIEKQSMKEL